MSERPRLALRGHLDLVCAFDPVRGTYLARQSFSAPIHLSKAYWNGGVLLINVVNQTAGIFGGDGVETKVVVEPGARVLLVSPSAARFHPSHGREARLRQLFEVRAGASLDVFPEISIPQRDSRSLQETVIRVERERELLYLETLAPGRVASGETFAFARYAWRTDITIDGRLVHRERAAITPGDASSAGLRALSPGSYYAGLIVIAPEAEKWEADFPREISAQADGFHAQLGASRLNFGGWSIRLLTADSLALRESIRCVRHVIHARLGRVVPDVRRSG